MDCPDSRALSEFTTFQIGGPADSLVVARTEEELVDAVRMADAESTPVLIISGGSNMLIADEGFRGTAVAVATQGVATHESPIGVTLKVAAGEPWDSVVALTVDMGWSGVEMLSGIPGLVGAVPVQNIGAYGAEVASAIAKVQVYDRRTGSMTSFTHDECHFGYRTSVFKEEHDRYVVLTVYLHLSLGSSSTPIAYAELARHLGVDVGAKVPLADARRAVLELRRGKGMVLDKTDHDTWSAGSFFTNPIIDLTTADSLPLDAPRFPQPDGTVKTSAAWLIDHAGFHKGYGTPPATLSTKHVLALTNRGGARASDILALARTIRDGVRTAYGITLVPEPTLVGLTL